MQLSNKWNREDRKIPECDPWTMSDIINSCICLQWEREFVLGIGSELKDDVKENINEQFQKPIISDNIKMCS